MAGGEELANPILNGPYSPPERHFEIDRRGPTGKVLAGRRPSESFVPVPVTRKGRGRVEGEQVRLDFDTTGERREPNSLVNDVRRRVELWRGRRYPGVTPVTRKLLEHWAAGPPEREERMLFCQREAAETTIYLAEVAGRHGEPDFRTRVDEQNAVHNDGLPRVALKMATGSGKTIVMCMLIAWQTVNKVANPRDARFAKRFLVVAPGITIRDRLRVIQPSDPGNYYRLRGIVPPDLWHHLRQAEVAVVNRHVFEARTAKEVRGVASGTRRLLAYGRAEGVADPFLETPDDVATRVLRTLGDPTRLGEIVVLNDEAHHCYQDRPAVEPVELDAAEKREVSERNVEARVWFKGLQALRRKVGLKVVYDLSATPFYLKGSGYNEGHIFGWVVSDFSLMDAIESGIVKVPRMPVDDDAAGDDVTYLQLWDLVGKALPKGRRSVAYDDWVIPEELEGALRSLYRSYADAHRRFEATLAVPGEPPPVFIVVCPNIVVSELVHRWIAGDEDRPGNLPLLANADEHGRAHARPRTILVNSAELEDGDVLSEEFKRAAGEEIRAFKAELRRRDPGVDLDAVGDADLLREVMNTVGKPGMLGEQVRCVVSVSMLTEGWDANTVSHILGIRRFASQLLCEQVVGRGLRRRSYATGDDGRFAPEYAEVYGVPFAWLGGAGAAVDPTPAAPAIPVHAVAERAGLEITFPHVDGYRTEVPEEPFEGDFGPDAAWRVERNQVATWVRLEGAVGAGVDVDLDEHRHARVQHVAFELARTLVARHYTVADGVERPWLFPQLAGIAKRWLTECVTYGPGAFPGLLLFGEAGHRAAEKLARDVVAVYPDRTRAVLVPLFRSFDPVGSTAAVDFMTRKPVMPGGTTRSHVDHVVGDSGWEFEVAHILEHHDRVAAYVKNDHLGFEIPYVHEGRTRRYLPDFLVRLQRAEGDPVAVRTLIVEVSGGRKKIHDPVPVQVKAATARDRWCRAVNDAGGHGRWGFVELVDGHFAGPLNAAVAELEADGPVTGLGE